MYNVLHFDQFVAFQSQSYRSETLLALETRIQIFLHAVGNDTSENATQIQNAVSQCPGNYDDLYNEYLTLESIVDCVQEATLNNEIDEDTSDRWNILYDQLDEVLNALEFSDVSDM